MDNQTPESATAARRRPARRHGGPLHPRPADLHLARGRARAGRLPRRPRRRGPGRRARRRWLGLQIAREQRLDRSAPTAEAPGRHRAPAGTRRRARDRHADPGPHRQLGRRALLDPGAPTRSRGGLRRAAHGAGHGPRTTSSTAVKDSGLRGRGGAGFPTGMKWGFIPQDNPKPKYLVVNADESEPGTCKDIPLMMASPHTLVEGVIISSYAIRANRAFIYVRGEVLHVIRRLQRAVARRPTRRPPRHEHPRLRLRPRAGRARRRRRLHLRRGDGAARLARGPPRPAAAAPAVPRGGRPLRQPDGDQQRRVDRLGAEHHRQRRRLVLLDGHREVQGLRHLLAVRPRHEPRPVRGPAGHHAARADRPGRRHPRGPRAEVLDARRLLAPRC